MTRTWPSLTSLLFRSLILLFRLSLPMEFRLPLSAYGLQAASACGVQVTSAYGVRLQAHVTTPSSVCNISSEVMAVLCGKPHNTAESEPVPDP